MFKTLVKYITNKTLRPIISIYLSKPRKYKYKGLILQIPPGVFHPSFFFSTKILLAYVKDSDINGKTFLELGAGSGLISLCAQKKGAVVTATDINKTAVLNLEKNSLNNKININIILSDLFQSIPPQAFDFIAINPPYYKKDPVTEAEHAWYCGENGEYFTKLFRDLQNYMHHYSHIVMVLSDECDIEMIKKTASIFHFQLKLEKEQRKYFEILFLYKIVITKISKDQKSEAI